jgi:protein O-mannosyl-transferase
LKKLDGKSFSFLLSRLAAKTRFDAVQTVSSVKSDPLATQAAGQNWNPPRPLPLWLSTFTRRGNGAALGLLLFLVTAGVFSPSLRDDFVAWDDDHTFYQNPHIQGLDAARLHWMFTDVSYSLRYKPLSWLAYALIYQVNGMKPLGFHLLGLLLHCSNAVLCFVVLRRLLAAGFERSQDHKTDDVISLSAAMGALLWAVHPLRVEPVARATDLTYDQSLVFTLISLWCYLRAVADAEGGAIWNRWYAGAVTAFGLAMLSYPFVFGYAGVLVVLDFYPLERLRGGVGGSEPGAVRRIFLEKVPFLLLASLIGFTIFGRLNNEDTFPDWMVGPQLGPFGRAMQALYVWAYYLWKPWVPFHLSPIYATLVDFNPWDWPFVASAVGVIGLTFILVWKRHVWPLGLACWACYLVLLLPALGLTEHPHFTNDRYDHVPGMLWSVLIAAGYVRYCRRFGHPLRMFALLSVVTAILAFQSCRQLRVWRDTPALFGHMIAELGDNPLSEFIHECFGSWYATQSNPGGAAREFQIALGIGPNHPDAHKGLGMVLASEGQLDDAVRQLREAARLDPDDPMTQKWLGATLVLVGAPGEAVTHYQEALKLAPEDFEVHEQLAILLCNEGRTAEGIVHFKAALASRPDFAGAHNGLGGALLNVGKLDDAIVQFQEALNLQPDYPEAHNGLGVALFKQGQIDEAISHFQMALKLRPDYADAHINLEGALARKSKTTRGPGFHPPSTNEAAP